LLELAPANSCLTMRAMAVGVVHLIGRCRIAENLRAVVAGKRLV
jgi:hypothetical protein